MACLSPLEFIVMTILWTYCDSTNTGAGHGWIDTAWKDIPYMVEVRTNINETTGSFSICGGSILTLDGYNGKGAILTAAHCVTEATTHGYPEPRELGRMKFYVGCTSTKCRTDWKTIYYAESILVHPHYAGDIYTNNYQENDIAIVYLTAAITHPKAIPVVLETDPLLAANNDAIILTGYYGKGASDLDTLEIAVSHIMTRSECDDYFEHGVTTAADFCMKDDISDDGNATICKGDSGSPVMFEGKQIGINSFGFGGCDPGLPQVAAYVPTYIDWIRSECGGVCVTQEYLGCYKDTLHRALRYGPQDYGYTMDTCRAACDGYKYFALQNGGWCSCENDYDYATKYGVDNNCPTNRLGGVYLNELFYHHQYKHRGCYKDTSYRALRSGPRRYGFNEISCSAQCREYKYFALQNNGECFCESNWNSATQYGSSTDCRANRLGGLWANDVFENTGYYHSLGCFKDEEEERALRYGPQEYGYSPATCRSVCAEYEYFALQNGGLCSCDYNVDHATKYGPSEACLDNGLGGVWANNLYKTVASNTLIADLNIPIFIATLFALFGVVSMLIIIVCFVNLRKSNKTVHYKKVEQIDVNLHEVEQHQLL